MGCLDAAPGEEYDGDPRNQPGGPMKRILATVLLAAAAVLGSPAASMAKDTSWGG